MGIFHCQGRFWFTLPEANSKKKAPENWFLLEDYNNLSFWETLVSGASFCCEFQGGLDHGNPNHQITSIYRLLGQAGSKKFPGFAPLPGGAFHPPGQQHMSSWAQEPWRSDSLTGRKRNSKKKMGWKNRENNTNMKLTIWIHTWKMHVVF